MTFADAMLHRTLSPLFAAIGVMTLVLLGAGCAASQGTTSTASTAEADSNVVATYADQVLTLSEFERQYAQSVGGWERARQDSLAAYEDFLERYVDFRLKVRAAEAAGYASDSTLQAEIRDYRASFAKPYLLDKEVLNPLIEAIYERQREMVDVSHILIQAGPQATPADTLAAYDKIVALKDSIEQGADFNALAYRHSEDPSARERKGRTDHPGYRGRLGFFSAGRMVLPFEDAAYTTPVGDVSDVVRTRFGYHLLFVHDRQPARQDVNVSHIMIRPGTAQVPDTAAALELAQDLKAQIDSDSSFARLASEYSADQRTARQGGQLGWLNYDNFNIPESFREAAFALDTLGAVSDVVQTPFGYHLIKLNDRKEPGTLQEEYERLKQTVSQLPRAQAAEDSLRRDILATYGASIDTAAVERLFDGVATDSIVTYLVAGQYPSTQANVPVARLGDSTYTVDQWSDFAEQSRLRPTDDRTALLHELADQFLMSSALDYGAATLEERDAEFRRIMQEFRDGLMLFQLMEDSVWTAAARDTAALKAYFEAHREEYRYPERTRVISLSTTSDSVMTSLTDRIDAGTLTLAQLAADLDEDTTATARLDTMLIGERSNTAYDAAVGLEPGGHTQTFRDQDGQTVMFNDGTVPARPKTFEEARAAVVSDYQSQIEDALITSLRERYDARTFPSRLRRAFQGPAPASLEPDAPGLPPASPGTQ